MPRPVLGTDTIRQLRKTARQHESLAHKLSTDEQLQLLLDRHEHLLDQLGDIDDLDDYQPTTDHAVGQSPFTPVTDEQPVDLSDHL
jgi:hypothetical protein